MQGQDFLFTLSTVPKDRFHTFDSGSNSEIIKLATQMYSLKLAIMNIKTDDLQCEFQGGDKNNM